MPDETPPPEELEDVRWFSVLLENRKFLKRATNRIPRP